MNPNVFRPALADKLAETLRQLELPRPPHITAEARGATSDIEALRVDGELALGPASFRGVPAENVQATLHYENSVLSVAPFSLKRSTMPQPCRCLL